MSSDCMTGPYSVVCPPLTAPVGSDPAGVHDAAIVFENQDIFWLRFPSPSIIKDVPPSTEGHAQVSA